jgi:myo-inositol-1(or 4)-monophosphatase
MDDYPVNLNEATKFIIAVATQAGLILKEYFLSKNIKLEKKNMPDILTEADLTVDKFLIKTIKKKYPNSNFLTEETSPEDYLKFKNLKNLWVIDPLDGTLNFFRGNSNFAISIALVSKAVVKLGVVYIPMTEELYWAQEKDKNAYLSNKVVYVSKTADVNKTIVACDWEWNPRERKNISYCVNKFACKVQQIKCMGSASSDLASIASGKIDAYIHFNLKPWDVAAASLIIEKAGGIVSTADGKKWNIFSPNIFATNNLLHTSLLRLIEKK